MCSIFWGGTAKCKSCEQNKMNEWMQVDKPKEYTHYNVSWTLPKKLLKSHHALNLCIMCQLTATVLYGINFRSFVAADVF
jgi:hypothetical protein